jgi:AraC-like DNA-binding protein
MDWWMLYHFLLLFGAVQGLVLAATLFWGSSANPKASRFLALILFFFAYHLLAEFLISTDISNINNWGYHALLEYNWIYGALIYFFTLSYLKPTFKFRRAHWWHFLPVLIEFLFSNWVKIQNFYWNGSQESLSWFGAQSYVLWMHTPLNFLISCGLILYYVRQSKKLLAESQTQVTPKATHWLKLILNTYQFFSIGVIFLLLIDYIFYNYAFNPIYQFPTYIGMTMITYWLGLQGYAKRKESPLLKSKQSVDDDKLEELKALLPRLEQLMQTEKLYLNPNLSLGDLAEALSTKPYLLTQLLNRVLQKSFNDFVNQYRVEETIRLINDPNYAHYNLMAIALESGFNSKATFNRIIKKFTGKSPKALKEE